MKKMIKIIKLKKITKFTFISLVLLLLFLSGNNLADNENDLQWNVELQLSEQTGKTSTLQFGESIDGSDGKDEYDIPIPAQSPGSGYIRTYFTTNLSVPYHNLMKEVKHYSLTNNEKQWNFTVKWIPYNEDQGTNITITWDKTNVQNTEYDSIILQRKGQINNTWYSAANMMQTNTYTWSHEHLSANPPYPETWFLTDYFKIIVKQNNTPPETPEILDGSKQGYHGSTYTYATKTIDYENNQIYYLIDWNDTSDFSWIGPYQQNQTISFDHIWDKPGNYTIVVKAKDEHGATTNWSQPLMIQMKNRLPNQPQNPLPENNSKNVKQNTILSWDGKDPDGDYVLYDIYFDTKTNPSKIISNQSSKTFSPILSSKTTYYWKIIAWDEFNEKSTSPVWSFTTKEFEKDEPTEINKPPDAVITDLPQNIFINTEITFNGSKSKDTDGYITDWNWNYGDGENGSGEVSMHSYTKPGDYTVELTVTDNQGLTDTATTQITVNTANNPPSKPILTKKLLNQSNKTYEFTVISTDKDNDFIHYQFQWGDKTNHTTALSPSNKTITVNHTWNSSGLFLINVTAKDNYSISQKTTMNILINARFVNSLGYLIDEDNDGYFDTFYSNKTKKQSAVQYENNSYLIDANTDGIFDHIFNYLSNTTHTYDSSSTIFDSSFILYFMVTIISIIIFLIIIFKFIIN